MKFLDQLQNPPREFTAIPFWFLNGDLTAEELRRQLADFAAHGIYGVVLHPRMGLSPDITYLGERYFAHIRTAVEAAAALDMKIVLYDEGMYPSGSASGLVVKDHPELASEGITLTQTVLPGDELLAQAENGALVVRKSGGTMRGLHWGEDDGEKNAPKTADILNPAAVSRFIELTHEAYYRELKAYFGTVIIGFFTDEPSILGRNVSGMLPWTHGFAEIFRRAGGNAANLAALFDGRENDDTRLYHKLLLQREGEVYYGTLSRWCEAHGIGLMGHPHQSDDIEVEKYFAVPGQDLVLRWLAPEKDGLAGIDSTMAKCSADAARLMHRRRNANECFGACNKDDNPWQLSGGDIKWYTDWLAVRGVNLFIPHAFYYSIRGKRKDERPPDVGPHSIWWAHYDAWSSYWRRLSWLMTDIDLHAEAAVLCRNRDLCPDTVRPLFERQIGFQYIPESYFPACTVEDGALCLHGHRYTAVLGDKALFPDAAHPEVSALEPDCRCDPPQPMLRCAYFNKEGRACWLLVNEGNTPIKTRLTLPVDAPLCRYDLWNGQPCACPAERTAKGACLPLELPARGSLLLFTCTARESEALPLPPTYLSLPRHTTDHSNGAADRHAAADPARAGDGRADCQRPAGGRLLLAAAQIPAGGAFDPRRKHPDADPDRQPRQPLRQAPGALRAGKINRFYSTGGTFMSVCTPKSFDLTGKVALITGASYGIGFAIATAMANCGATIVFNDIKQELVDKGLAAYKEAGIEAHGYVCDVTNEDAVNEMVKKITAEVGHINVLVNNAGIIKRIPMIEMTAAQFRQVIDVDLNAPFIVAKAVIPDMIEQGGGKIINICSMMSELGRETVSAYAAAKGGLKMLTKNIASEYGKYNIQCNGIGPGYIATPQTAPLREIQPDGSRHPFDQFIVAKTPAERWGKAEDLGGPAVFLASEASDFVNGLILYVDGGILAYIGKQPG